MNGQDIINLILGEPEDDFHGTVPQQGQAAAIRPAARPCRRAHALYARKPGHSGAVGNPPQRLPDTRRAASRCGAERICAKTFFHAHGTQRQRIAV